MTHLQEKLPLNIQVCKFKMSFFEWKIRDYLITMAKGFFIQSIGPRFLHIFSISRDGYHSKRKLHFSLTSIYRAIFVHPRNLSSAAEPVSVPSMKRGDNHKAPDLVNMAGGVGVPNQAKKLFLWPLWLNMQERCYAAEWLCCVFEPILAVFWSMRRSN